MSCASAGLKHSSVDPRTKGFAASGYSVERRSSGALSDLAGSAFGSDLTGSILPLSTAGVSRRAANSERGGSIDPAGSL
jgi:hypothetical protein